MDIIVHAMSLYDSEHSRVAADTHEQDFINKYWERQESLPSMKIPKAVDAWFADPKTEDERKIAAMIRDYDAKQLAKFEQEIFKQRKRLADAERSLQSKTTKKALEDRCIAADKVEKALAKLADVKGVKGVRSIFFEIRSDSMCRARGTARWRVA
jgi:hypothetical protein